MPSKPNPLKLNKLQSRTLALAQVIANEPLSSIKNEATGEVTLTRLPHAQGDHAHVGSITVAAKDISGFSNKAVWAALSRKGLSHGSPEGVISLTPDGLNYDTGLMEKLQPSTKSCGCC